MNHRMFQFLNRMSLQIVKKMLHDSSIERNFFLFVEENDARRIYVLINVFMKWQFPNLNPLLIL